MKRKAISILTAIFLLLATPSVGGVTVAGAESEAILTQTTQFGAEETSPPTEKAAGEGEVATPDTAPPSATEEAPPPAEGTAEPTAAEEETPPAAALIGEAVRQPVRLM
ncbi:MAG: hypothetical protein LBH86_05745, partial [Oscillospiraceae bacterium]|nr:hypothetical protein [Oscillospiraceae bacterium]